MAMPSIETQLEQLRVLLERAIKLEESLLERIKELEP